MLLNKNVLKECSLKDIFLLSSILAVMGLSGCSKHAPAQEQPSDVLFNNQAKAIADAQVKAVSLQAQQNLLPPIPPGIAHKKRPHSSGS